MGEREGKEESLSHPVPPPSLQTHPTPLLTPHRAVRERSPSTPRMLRMKPPTRLAQSSCEEAPNTMGGEVEEERPAQGGGLRQGVRVVPCQGHLLACESVLRPPSPHTFPLPPPNHLPSSHLLVEPKQDHRQLPIPQNPRLLLPRTGLEPSETTIRSSSDARRPSRPAAWAQVWKVGTGLLGARQVEHGARVVVLEDRVPSTFEFITTRGGEGIRTMGSAREQREEVKGEGGEGEAGKDGVFGRV